MKGGDDVNQYVTQSEFARRMNISYMTVRRWIKEGRIKTVIVAGKVRIPIEELKAKENN